MPADANTGPTCPKCAAPNPPGAQFCANCGSTLGVAGSSTFPPPPPPPPRGPQSWTQHQFMGGEPQAETTLQMDAVAAHAAVLSSIANMKGKVTADQPPTLVQFEIVKKNFWQTGGAAVYYRCEASITALGPMQSTVRVSSRMDWNRSTGFVIASVLILVLLGVLLVPIILVAVSLWMAASVWSKEIAEAVVRGLSAGASRPAVATPPQPAPAQPAPRPAPVAAAATDESVTQRRLRQLKELHDGGVLTDEEFAAKKAELLSGL